MRDWVGNGYGCANEMADSEGSGNLYKRRLLEHGAALEQSFLQDSVRLCKSHRGLTPGSFAVGASSALPWVCAAKAWKEENAVK